MDIWNTLDAMLSKVDDFVTFQKVEVFSKYSSRLYNLGEMSCFNQRNAVQ